MGGFFHVGVRCTQNATSTNHRPRMRNSRLPTLSSEHWPSPREVSERLVRLEINNPPVQCPAYEDLPTLVRDPALLFLNPVRENPRFISGKLPLSSLLDLR